MFLPVVETVIEGLGRIRDLFQFGATCRKVFRAEPKAFDQVAFLVMLLAFSFHSAVRVAILSQTFLGG
jgi:hypothetical protein